MKGFWYGLSISLAFIIGCVTAPLIVPPLTAQNAPAGVQRWAYTCLHNPSAAQLATLGGRGWEMAAGAGAGGGTLGGRNALYFCFKRPL